ncbi:multicopper oxidase-domain-containing protein [Emericellopsis atlantica]|uniref:Multicopper oxidase-domain-containing protein n=1 Tax=Emericellopsis atlantica TaxID=2614577 RepID=A0A9P8CKS8_9HYPO|nr:multicopper oxidase-domain-containing protein [Emericellopsis atlantica]KAG9250362.1 multicopper oxidase-domain-containing protein [Emericellopsis atlantica]
MDGVPGVPIVPGGNFTYRFSAASEYGFFWYYSYFRAYYNDAIRGPLLIRPSASPLLAAERDAANILLNDWTYELSDAIFSRYNSTGAFLSCVDRRSETLTSAAGRSISMAMALRMGSLSLRGCMPPMMFKPGFDIALRVSLDGHSMFVYAADGLYTNMQKVNRYSVMVKLNRAPGEYYLRFGRAIVWYNTTKASNNNVEDLVSDSMYVNGSAKSGAALLDALALTPFENNLSPPSGLADKTLSFMVNQTDILSWVIDRAPFEEPSIPIIYGNISLGWDSVTTRYLPINLTIDIVMGILNQSLDKMGHPIYLHGYKFWVLGSGVGTFLYATIADAPADILNLKNPLYRDTTGLPSQGWVVIRYVTDNPGAWIFYCHL